MPEAMVPTSMTVVAFRVDASLQIGSGHLMRCLALADLLRDRGARCHFVCREHPGHLFDAVRERGHGLSALPTGGDFTTIDGVGPRHASWLGCDWTVDAAQTAEALHPLAVDWLVVDHYGLDAEWERSLAQRCRKVLVIDDLADREHDCDLLLDQTEGRDGADYRALVPSRCELLVGARFALLRPEFAALREHSLARRRVPQLRHVLVSMGGVDRSNATAHAMKAIAETRLPADLQLSIVMGAAAPHLEKIRQLADLMPIATSIKVDVRNMGVLLARTDLAIGAGGSSSWERCCLGVPALVCILAENQRKAAMELQKLGAALVVGDKGGMEELAPTLQRLAQSPDSLAKMSLAARKVTDGMGTRIVAARMEAALV